MDKAEHLKKNTQTCAYSHHPASIYVSIPKLIYIAIDFIKRC